MSSLFYRNVRPVHFHFFLFSFLLAMHIFPPIVFFEHIYTLEMHIVAKEIPFFINYTILQFYDIPWLRCVVKHVYIILQE